MKKSHRRYLKLVRWRQHYLSDKNFLVLLSIATGLLVGLAAVLLKSLVHLVERLVIDYSPRYLLVFLPMTGILITLFLTHRVFKERGVPHGLTAVLDAIARKSSVMKPSLLYSHLVTAAITVGLGGSVGLEAPIVVTGSAIGSETARRARLSYRRRTLFIGCGTAAGIAAIFNAPIAGVVFAIEVILPEVTTSLFIPVLISAATSNLVSNLIMGQDVPLKISHPDVYTPRDLPFFLLLGIAGGAMSLYFDATAQFIKAWLHRVKRHRNRAIWGGILLGGIIYLLPPLYGEGYLTLKKIMNGNVAGVLENASWRNHDWVLYLLPAYLLVLSLLKPVAASLTIEAGGMGGTFGPSLVTGGLLGASFAMMVNAFQPVVQLSPLNFCLLGMASLLSGVMLAPLTAIFLIAEITQSYELMVPLMIVSAIAYFTKAYSQPIALYARSLVTESGLMHGDKDRLVLSEMDLLRLIEKDIVPVPPEASLRDLVEVVSHSRRNIFPVVTASRELLGVILLDDIRQIMFDTSRYDNTSVSDLMHLPPALVYHTDTMEEVMQKFDQTHAWNLPVLRNQLYVGFISKSTIFSQYRQQLRLRNEWMERNK